MKNIILCLPFILFMYNGLFGQTIMNIHQSNGTVIQIPTNTIDSITFTISNPGNLATISTTAISSNTGTSAVSGGNITNGGGSPITQRGVCWSTNPNPITANIITINGSGTGSFISNLTGLTANTTYYVRAYAINSAGTAYGNQVSFTTTSGSITSLNCSSASTTGTLTAGILANGVTCSVPYTGGNGGTYNSQNVLSSSVTGLTATLTAGNFASGTGTLQFIISGTPSSSGIASFALNIGGQNCTLNLSVISGIVSNPGPGVTFNGYTYSTIILGNGQEWISENLRTNVYANGDPIPNITDSAQWRNLTTGAWVYYNNDSQYENPYGKLYNWYVVSDQRNVCPIGWHVPSDAEWIILRDYLFGITEAGGKMKSTGTQYWQTPNTGATNESGFSGLPGGNRAPYTSIYDLIGIKGYWWTSTEYNQSNAECYDLSYNSDLLHSQLNGFSKLNGFSVRCIKD